MRFLPPWDRARTASMWMDEMNILNLTRFEKFDLPQRGEVDTPERMRRRVGWGALVETNPPTRLARQKGAHHRPPHVGGGWCSPRVGGGFNLYLSRQYPMARR